MEIAAFLIAFLIVLVAVRIGWSRIPIVWRRPGRDDEDRDSGTTEG